MKRMEEKVKMMMTMARERERETVPARDHSPLAEHLVQQSC